MPNWTREWPTQSGHYWFYGWCFHGHDNAPQLFFVKVRQIQNGLAYITEGHFLYEAEGARGVWQEAELPKLPDSDFAL